MAHKPLILNNGQVEQASDYDLVYLGISAKAADSDLLDGHDTAYFQTALTFGIADTNKVQINSADVADNDYAKFTATGLEGRSYSEVLSDIGAQAANSNLTSLAGLSFVSTSFVKMTSAGTFGLDTNTYSLSSHNHSGVYEPVISAGTSAQYLRGDKTWQTLNQAAVAGLTTTDSPVFAGLGIVNTAAATDSKNYWTAAYPQTGLNTGAHPGTTAANNNQGNPDWSNPTYVLANDVNSADCNLGSGQDSDILNIQGFHTPFADIPDDATIVGIYVEATGKESDSDYAAEVLVQLLNASGNLFGDNKADGNQSSWESVSRWGGASDMWGLNSTTLTPAIIKNAGGLFGIAFQATADPSEGNPDHVYFQYLTMTVYYTDPNGLTHSVTAGIKSSAGNFYLSNGATLGSSNLLTITPAGVMDIATASTIGSAYIYRVGGTDVAVADGGTNKSSWTNGVPYVFSNAFGTVIGNTQGQVLMAGASPNFTPVFSTPAFPNTAASGKGMVGNGTAWVENTSAGINAAFDVTGDGYDDRYSLTFTKGWLTGFVDHYC